MLRISIDSRYIRERPSGIGEYVQALVDRVPALAPEDRFHLWVDPRAPRRPLSALDNVSESTVRAPANSLRTLLWPARLVDLSHVDVLHAPFNILGRGVPCAAVTTIHDLIWVYAPAMSEGVSPVLPVQALFYRDGIMRALRRSSRLVTISAATAESVAWAVPEARRRIRVIHHGVDARFCPPESRAEVQAAMSRLIGDERPYLLVVGQNAPFKNHAGVLRAFAASGLGPRGVRLVLLQRLQQGRGRLSLFGEPGLGRVAQELGIEEQVTWLPRVSGDEAVQLFQGALALVQFSRYEGFGMPVLEALACGTPVVASDIAPLTEVLGGAGLQVPLEGAALAGALRRIFDEPNVRQELQQAGLERAGDFSWDRCAQQHLEVYREAAAEGPVI